MLTREEISAFAAEWYRKLDEHVPADDVISMVAERDLEFHLPETVLRTTDDFRRWYSGGGGLPGVINVFFDETHALSQVDLPGQTSGRSSRSSSTGGPDAGRHWHREANGLASTSIRRGRWCGRFRPAGRSSPVTWSMK